MQYLGRPFNGQYTRITAVKKLKEIIRETFGVELHLKTACDVIDELQPKVKEQAEARVRQVLREVMATNGVTPSELKMWVNLEWAKINNPERER